MKFGYFTLSDNHYANNDRERQRSSSPTSSMKRSMPRSSAIHSAWIGEHHFSSLGRAVLPRSGAGLCRGAHASASAWRPRSPCCRCIIRSGRRAMGDARPLSGGRVDFAAGRGYDRREYAPFKVDFDDNQAIFEEGMEVVRRLWASDGPISHHGKHYHFDDVVDHAAAGAAARSPPMSPPSRSRRSSWRRGSAAASSSRRLPRP